MKVVATKLTDETYKIWMEEKVKPSNLTSSAYLHALIIGQVPDQHGDVVRSQMVCPFGCGFNSPPTVSGKSDMRMHVFFCPEAY